MYIVLYVIEKRIKNNFDRKKYEVLKLIKYIF